jgi:hypothetical protein
LFNRESTFLGRARRRNIFTRTRTSACNFYSRSQASFSASLPEEPLDPRSSTFLEYRRHLRSRISIKRTTIITPVHTVHSRVFIFPHNTTERFYFWQIRKRAIGSAPIRTLFLISFVCSCNSRSRSSILVSNYF